MNRRDIVIGIIILLVAGGFLYYRSKNTNEVMKVPDVKSDQATTEKNLEDKFKVDIPDDTPKAELKDVSGGNASAIATRKDEDGNHTVTILADLPDPTVGSFYQGWIVKGEEGQEDYSLISLGKLILSKGGYKLDYQSKTDYSDHTKVIVSEETSKTDKTIKPILEGNF